MEIPGKKFPQILVYMYLAMLSSFPEISENPVSFVTGNYLKFKPKFFTERKASFVAQTE